MCVYVATELHSGNLTIFVVSPFFLVFVVPLLLHTLPDSSDDGHGLHKILVNMHESTKLTVL